MMQNDAELRGKIMDLQLSIKRLTECLTYSQPLHSNELEDLEQAARYAKDLSVSLSCFVNNEKFGSFFEKALSEDAKGK